MEVGVIESLHEDGDNFRLLSTQRHLNSYEKREIGSIWLKRGGEKLTLSGLLFLHTNFYLDAASD
jgi:hypothetical protein